MKKTPHLLCILDGFGLNPRREGNAVAMAKTPVFSNLWDSQPHSTLTTFGTRVGLPEGQMGNSEVGHLNIGAGRVVEQWLTRISNALRRGDLQASVEWKHFLDVLSTKSKVHVMGLWSDGGVHSHSEHLYLLLKQLRADFQGSIVLHLFTDGRDTSPTRAGEQLQELETLVSELPGISIGSISGRYYAMDRDNRWERTEQAFRAVAGIECKERFSSAREAIERSYANRVTDEFLLPSQILSATASPSQILPEDGLIFFNFREDRARQIIQSLCLQDFSGFKRPADFKPFSRDQTLCLTQYDETYQLPVLFPPQRIQQHLGQVVSSAGLTQLRTAETEKYPHVTYFLNGGEEQPFKGEDRLLLPSPRDVATYDLKPEMSAVAVTDRVVKAIQDGGYDLIVVNLANCDMVGHTGVVEAAVRAVETVDACLGRMIAAIETHQGVAIILADHGNAEMMIDYETGEPHTAHTMFPVPVIVVDAANGSGKPKATPKHRLRDDGALCDIAPTLLALMKIPQPSEMTGRSLLA